MSAGAAPDVEVVCVGDLMHDVLAVLSGPVAAGTDTPARISSGGGGSAANVAAWLAAGGTTTAYVGRTGTDLAGAASVALLTQTGVQTYVVRDPRRPTGTCVVLVGPDGARSMLPDPGANLALSPGDVPGELFLPGRHLHLTGYSLAREGPRPAALHALALARAAGMTVSVDPSSVALLTGAAGGALLAASRGVDLLLPNLDEARVLTGERDPLAAARALTAVAGTVVVTLGADGAVLADATGGSARVGAHDVRVVDTTGAGDAFAAGFLAARRAGAGAQEALAAAADTAARAVTAAGARPPERPHGPGDAPSVVGRS